MSAAPALRMRQVAGGAQHPEPGQDDERDAQPVEPGACLGKAQIARQQHAASSPIPLDIGLGMIAAHRKPEPSMRHPSGGLRSPKNKRYRHLVLKSTLYLYYAGFPAIV